MYGDTLKIASGLGQSTKQDKENEEGEDTNIANQVKKILLKHCLTGLPLKMTSFFIADLPRTLEVIFVLKITKFLIEKGFIFHRSIRYYYFFFTISIFHLFVDMIITLGRH